MPETAAQQLDMGAAYREARTLFTSGGLGYQATGALSMLIGSASSLLLGGLMNAGMWTLSLRKLRGEDEVGFGELFAHSSKFLPLLLASLATVGLTLLGLPLLVVGMFFLSGGFAYTLPLIAERDMGVKEALQTSWRLARSGGLAKHALLAFLTALPGLALMVPALGFVVYGLLTPYVFGVWAAAYRQVTGELKPENAIRLGGMQAAKGGPKQDLAEKDSPPAKGDDAAD